jgi:UDP-N-acetylmuramoyl-tripeptide--D-alanyl-D-alanine ligase
MSVFELDTLRRTIGGEWLQRSSNSLAGTGAGGASNRNTDDRRVDNISPASQPLPAGAGEVFITGVGIDSRENLSGKAFFAIKGEQHDGHDFLTAAVDAGAALLIVERDIVESNLPSDVPIVRVDSTRKALAKLALAHRRSLVMTKVIGITGSAGKTTTKRLIHSILSQSLTGSCAPKSFNNDIGVPLTLLAAQPRDRYVIVEIGTNAPGEIGALAALAEPDIVVITNVGRAHLEKLGNVENVAREKAAILNHLRPDGMAILNADSIPLRDYYKLADHVVTFGEAEDADLRLTNRGMAIGDQHSTVGSLQSARGDAVDEPADGRRPPAASHPWLEVNGRVRFRLAMPGRHNALNAIAAIAVGRRMGLTDEQIEAGLMAADPEPMRMASEYVGGIIIFNDAYNANPDSTVASLVTFGELAADADRRVIVLGDMLELGEHGPELHREVGGALRDLHNAHPVGLLILVGSLVEHVAGEVAVRIPAENVLHIPALDDKEIARITSKLKPGDALLLKGSRRIGLERIAAALCDRVRQAAPQPTGHGEHARG